MFLRVNKPEQIKSNTLDKDVRIKIFKGAWPNLL